MKLPAQAPKSQRQDQQLEPSHEYREGRVHPAGGGIECEICKAACQLLSGPAKAACLLACNLTVC